MGVPQRCGCIDTGTSRRAPTPLPHPATQVRCMAAVLLMVGRGEEPPGIVATLLDPQQVPRKPQYTLASGGRRGGAGWVAACAAAGCCGQPAPWQRTPRPAPLRQLASTTAAVPSRRPIGCMMRYRLQRSLCCCTAAPMAGCASSAPARTRTLCAGSWRVCSQGRLMGGCLQMGRSWSLLGAGIATAAMLWCHHTGTPNLLSPLALSPLLQPPHPRRHAAHHPAAAGERPLAARWHQRWRQAAARWGGGGYSLLQARAAAAAGQGAGGGGAAAEVGGCSRASSSCRADRGA